MEPSLISNILLIEETSSIEKVFNQRRVEKEGHHRSWRTTQSKEEREVKGLEQL